MIEVLLLVSTFMYDVFNFYCKDVKRKRVLRVEVLLLVP